MSRLMILRQRIPERAPGGPPKRREDPVPETGGVVGPGGVAGVGRDFGSAGNFVRP